MKILLLHPEDDPLAGPWVGERWDAVYDLAHTYVPAYERWEQTFRCPVSSIDQINDADSVTGKVRELLHSGRGQLVDREGVDWWELTTLFLHQQIQMLVSLTQFAVEIPPSAEVSITRECFEAKVLRIELGSRVRVLRRNSLPERKGLAHYTRRLRRLSGSQVLNVLGDKYDGRYRVRRYLHRLPPSRNASVVLLPSAYVNVSLSGMAYARLLPDTNFLLVATRRSGRLQQTPPNVRQSWLAAYVTESQSEEEGGLLAKWRGMQRQIAETREWSIAAALGLFNDFPRRLSEGLVIRNAWRQVLQWEAVSAVVCGDDSNPYTHLPLLLAKARGLPTIAYHHGAFDGRYLFKSNHADVILAKGDMERDYLQIICGVDPEEIEIGAPAMPNPAASAATETCRDQRKLVVFFSEPYEMASERAAEIYRDIVPRLARLCASAKKKFVIKLHPAESLHDRKRLVNQLLQPEQASAIEWRTGQLDRVLLENIWCGITVHSSVVLDCAAQAIPCFRCDWLEMWPYKYVAQFRKFNVGLSLASPEEIANIPETLQQPQLCPDVVQDCWHTIARERFRDLLCAERSLSTDYSCAAVV